MVNVGDDCISGKGCGVICITLRMISLVKSMRVLSICLITLNA